MAYWTDTEGSMGLFTHAEAWARAGLVDIIGFSEKFRETLYQETEAQRELESIAGWLQSKDPNGEYIAVCKAFRDMAEPGPYGLTLRDTLAQLLNIVDEWHDENTTEADERLRFTLTRMRHRLERLLATARGEYIRRLHHYATLLREYDESYPAEHAEAWAIWRTLVNSRGAYGVTLNEILSIKNAHGL